MRDLKGFCVVNQHQVTQYGGVIEFLAMFHISRFLQLIGEKVVVVPPKESKE